MNSLADIKSTRSTPTAQKTEGRGQGCAMASRTRNPTPPEQQWSDREGIAVALGELGVLAEPRRLATLMVAAGSVVPCYGVRFRSYCLESSQVRARPRPDRGRCHHVPLRREIWTLIYRPTSTIRRKGQISTADTHARSTTQVRA